MTDISRILLLSVISVMLAGCTGDTPAPIITVVEAAPINLPDECTVSDPAWTKLADGDVRKADIARNIASNHRQYSRVLSRRAVCRAAIKSIKKG